MFIALRWASESRSGGGGMTIGGDISGDTAYFCFDGGPFSTSILIAGVFSTFGSGFTTAGFFELGGAGGYSYTTKGSGSTIFLVGGDLMSRGAGILVGGGDFGGSGFGSGLTYCLVSSKGDCASEILLDLFVLLSSLLPRADSLGSESCTPLVTKAKRFALDRSM